MRFTIQHPSKWKVDDDVKGFPDEVWFRSPDSQIRKFAISVEKFEPNLDTDTMTLKNTSLQQLAQEQLDDYRSASAHFNLPFTVIRQNKLLLEVILDGRWNILLVRRNITWRFLLLLTENFIAYHTLKIP